VQGPILISYGSPRTAELKWKGTLIGASEGTQVKAVAPGQVVYADWLDGFGMLLVIDHGKGYMSLYGHNQSLLRQVGQKVEQGNPWPGRRQRRTGATRPLLRDPLSGRGHQPDQVAGQTLGPPWRCPSGVRYHLQPFSREGTGSKRQQHRVVYHFT
jgi:hypothetical protein